MGKTAFIFAGQGSQAPGMGKELYEISQGARTTMDALEALSPGLLKMAFSGTQEELNLTENTQPCLFAVSLAAAAALTDLGIRAGGAAGFSLGELTAAAYTGLMLPEAAFAYCLRRAAAMTECADKNPGAMAAILKLDNAAVEALCAQVGNVWPANYNAPGQLVVSGLAGSVDELCALVSQQRGRAIRLAVSGGFHSPLMGSASEALLPVLRSMDIQTPGIPQWANLSAELFSADNAAEWMAGQVSGPVRWEQTIRRMLEDGFDTFVELGPGQVLNGLVKKIAPETRRLHVEDAESLRLTAEALASC